MYFRNPLALGMVCLLLVGCSSGTSGLPEPERFPVSGSVTLNGAPLASGLIYFKTVQTGATDSVDIKEGKFDGRAQAGDRRVEVCAYEPIPSQGNDPMAADRQKNLIPPKYNVESELTAKVTREGPNQFSFELSSH